MDESEVEMVEAQPRMSGPTLKVLKSFVEQPRVARSGAEVSKVTKVGPGSIYAIMARLEKAGWLESTWEEVDPRDAGRPRRRLYRITAKGQERTNAALAELQVESGGLAWAR